jgi:hypothetical protein
MKLLFMRSRYTFLLVFVSLFAACDRVPLTSPTGSTITLTVNQATVPINGSVEVIAAVIEAGGTAVHDGTTVTFTGSLGRFNPIEAQTVAGIARSTFTGTSSGTVMIGAFSGAAKATEVELKVGAAAAGSVSLQVVPPTVGQNGGTVSVTALVLDSGGNALPGVPVIFSVNTGTLSNGTVLSDTNGYAVTNLVTTRAATVTARAGTATPVTFEVGVSTAPTVTITTSTTAPIAGQPVAFTITPSTATTASPISSVLVEFGDGQSQLLGAITGPVGLTHVFARQGGYTVTATASDITGGRGVSSVSIVVGFESLPTVTLSGTPNPSTISNPAQAGVVTFTVTAAAGAAGGAPIRSVRVTLGDGTVIYSGTGGGTFAYRFGGAGTYTVTAIATDALGATATTSTAILINP